MSARGVVERSTITNEVRGGGNLAPGAFETKETFGSASVQRSVRHEPRRNRSSRRDATPDTFQYSDNGSWQRGRHELQFGGSLQQVRVNSYDFAGRFPVVVFGFSPAAPAARAADRGPVSRRRQRGRSGVGQCAAVVPVRDDHVRRPDLRGARPDLRLRGGNPERSELQPRQRRRVSAGQLALEAERHDSRRVEMGVLQPACEKTTISGCSRSVNGRSVRDALLDPNGAVTFVNGGFYNKDLNNFGPTVGFAWDPFKDGRTAVRGGYSLTFVNEETMTVVDNATQATRPVADAFAHESVHDGGSGHPRGADAGLQERAELRRTSSTSRRVPRHSPSIPISGSHTCIRSASASHASCRGDLPARRATSARSAADCGAVSI